MIVNLHNAEHYLWGNGRCDGWRLAAEQQLSLIQESVPPGASEILHIHRRATQIFYILDGDACLELNGSEHTLHPGNSLLVAPGLPHKFMNRGRTDVKFLVFSTPSTLGDRLDLPLESP